MLDRYTAVRIGHLTVAGRLPAPLAMLLRGLPASVRQAIGMEWAHARMGLRALLDPSVECWVVHEIFLQHASLMLFLLWLTRRDVVILLHGNRPLTARDRLKRVGLAVLNVFLRSDRFRIALFEIPDLIVPPPLRARTPRKFVIPIPARSDAFPSLVPGQRLGANERVVIGIIGMLRPGKPLHAIVPRVSAFVARHAESCDLLIGTPRSLRPDGLAGFAARVVDTEDDRSYLHALRSVHILVADFDAEDYSYRVSAVVNDAACSGCYLVVRRLPAIAQQVQWPVAVGCTFSEDADLEKCLETAVATVRAQGQDANWAWREGRSAALLAARLFPKGSSAASCEALVHAHAPPCW